MIGREPEALTPAQRIERVLGGQRPDRFAYFLNAGLHAAGLLGVPLEDLLSRVDLAVEGALLVQERLGNDLVTSFLHAAGEAQAFGGEVLFFDDGPPNAGTPPLGLASLASLRPPPIDHPALALRVEVTRALAARVAGRIPVAGALVAPFSLPVMQLGFSGWLDLLHEAPREAEHLIAVNLDHCIAFARAQLAAGASAILAFEPLASTQLVAPRIFHDLGLPALRRFGAAIGAPFAVSTASAPIAAVANDLVDAGALMIGASDQDDLVALEAATSGKAVILGNLNGLRMRAWTPGDVDREVRALVARLPASGRAVVTEHHGEVPLAVPFDTLVQVAQALRRHGRLPRRADG